MLDIHQWGLIREKAIKQVKSDDGRLIHKISTEEGQSGAPIILVEGNGTMNIVGIHKGTVTLRTTGERYNAGRLVTSTLVEELK